MALLSALLLGISTNLDNLFLGFTLGLGGERVSARANWIIGAFSAAATSLCCCLSGLFSGWGQAAKLLGGGLIVLLGLWTLLPPRRAAAAPAQGTAALGAALAVNCVPAAFAAGLAGLSTPLAAASVGLLSVLAIRTGNLLGLRAVGRLRAGRLRHLSGALMILLGALQILG